MKKISLITLALVSTLSFSACTSKDKPEEATQEQAEIAAESSTQQAMDNSVENSMDSAAYEVNEAAVSEAVASSQPLSLGASSSGLGR